MMQQKHVTVKCKEKEKHTRRGFNCKNFNFFTVTILYTYYKLIFHFCQHFLKNFLKYFNMLEIKLLDLNLLVSYLH